MRITRLPAALMQIADQFSLAPFERFLQPLIEEALQEEGKHRSRKGTLLTPKLLIWLVLVLTLRRDLNYDQAFNWMLSGFRWLQQCLPARSKLVSDGAISHARVALGSGVFKRLWHKLRPSYESLPADFHGLRTVIFDGTTATMPDTESNRKAFGKPNSGRGEAAFPQVRLMSLLAVAPRLLMQVAFAPCRGKGTGERTLVRSILDSLEVCGLLCLMDAGLYAFHLLWTITQKQGHFLVKVPRNVKFKKFKRLTDGSCLATLTGQIQTEEGKSQRRNLTVRLIRIEMKGFRPYWLMTSLQDEAISARQLALHYHKRWDIEISYDEIKTHQAATLRGQSPTTLRSKRADLITQEIYALAISYHLVRLLMAESAAEHGVDPTCLSFLESLQHIFDAAPILSALPVEQRQERYAYLLELVAHCLIDRPRRPRWHPRVVKVKMSKFAKKTSQHRSQERDIQKELRVVEVELEEAA
ncbi:IS4 family transposase [Candidatus Parcubacteria bacterium]|nr:MAG: IS4 family transposase [Candidatus Parcubacteria bacterium]